MQPMLQKKYGRKSEVYFSHLYEVIFEIYALRYAVRAQTEARWTVNTDAITSQKFVLMYLMSLSVCSFTYLMMVYYQEVILIQAKNEYKFLGQERSWMKHSWYFSFY
jgi:hypothetical protein